MTVGVYECVRAIMDAKDLVEECGGDTLSLENSLVITKLTEAEMWLVRGAAAVTVLEKPEENKEGE